MITLQIISALLLLLNKFFVFRKKTIGWTFGIWGTIAITLYFYLQMILLHKGDLWIMIVYDIALFFLMVYGYLISSSTTSIALKVWLKKHGLKIKKIIASVTTIVCLFLLYRASQTTSILVVQLLGAVTGLIGTLLLAINTNLSNKIGWISYFIAHCLVTYFAIKTDSPALAICQVASAIISLMGFWNELRTTKLEVPLLNNRL